MSAGAAGGRPPEPVARAPWRPWCLAGAAVVLAIAVLPPLASAARQTEWAQAFQVGLLALVVPALATLGAPWRLVGLSVDPGAGPGDRLAAARVRHPELIRSVAFVAVDLVVVVVWHTPAAVAWVAHRGWPVLLEALTLLAAGIGLWLELVDSPPLVPRSGHLRRAVLGTVVLWASWILAYVVALSTHDFYANFTHTAGGLSAAADQQIAAAVSWFVAALALIPVVFWNALRWLSTEEDPDAELVALLRAERRRGNPPHAAGDGPTAAP